MIKQISSMMQTSYAHSIANLLWIKSSFVTWSDYLGIRFNKFFFLYVKNEFFKCTLKLIRCFYYY